MSFFKAVCHNFFQIFSFEVCFLIYFLHFLFRLESYVDDKYKEFCRDQGKAEDVSILDTVAPELLCSISSFVNI